MTKIGIITRGKYGHRLIDTIKDKTNFEPLVANLPSKLPILIEEPEKYLDEIGLDQSIFNSDIIVSYSLHPDITTAIAKIASQRNVKSLIIPGGYSHVSMDELEKIAKDSNMHIEIDEICCALKEHENTKELTSVLGTPALEIDVKDKKIENVNVKKGAPCGSTWYMARNLKGIELDKASARAGLLVQQYPCRAIRGTEDGIHRSAAIHKKAVENALQKTK